MYVCLCHAITDSDIHAAAAKGARSVADLGAQLGVATGCGTCADTAQNLLDQANGRYGQAYRSMGTPAPVRRYEPAPA